LSARCASNSVRAIASRSPALSGTGEAGVEHPLTW
jgi:hypothetical protein